ncbi:MAG: hypothetical protein RLY40_623 [Pseudomonadota bacterium]|jgi:hypothetical protein
MDNRHLNLMLAFLLLGLRRYLRCSVPLNPQVSANIASVINLPFYDRTRDYELLARQIPSTPEFWFEVFIQMGMLMTAGYFFMRALQERPLTRPLLQPQASQASNADILATSQTSNETQHPTLSRNQAGFFSRNAENRLSRSESSESINSESSGHGEEASSSKLKKS